MKTIKRRVETFSFFDCQGISNHLEKMAAKGWMLQRITNFYWEYRAIEPKPLTFGVTYFPKASEFDPEPSPEQESFREFCAHTGWQLACSSAQMEIFYNENETPTPIQTEPMLEVETIHAAAKKNFIPSYCLLLVIALMNEGIFLSNFMRDPIGQLASPSQLFTVCCFIILFLLTVTELTCYFIWHHKAKTMAEQRTFLKPVSTAKFQRAVLGVILLAGLYWVLGFILRGDKLRRWIGIIFCFYMPGMFLLVNGIKGFLKKKKAEASVNRIATFAVAFLFAFGFVGAVTIGTLKLSSMGFFREDTQTYEYKGKTFTVYNDPLPLTVEDLTRREYPHSSKAMRGESSLLLSDYTCTQRPIVGAPDDPEVPYLRYRLVEVKMPILYRLCQDHLLTQEKYYLEEGWEYRSTDPTPWGADRAYQLYEPFVEDTPTYLLCYKRTLAELQLDRPPTAQQMKTVGEKLGS